MPATVARKQATPGREYGDASRPRLRKSTNPLTLSMTSPFKPVLDIDAVALLVPLTEEYDEHDFPVSLQRLVGITGNVWFESDLNTRHYVLSKGSDKICVTCKLRDGLWIPHDVMGIVYNRPITWDLSSANTTTSLLWERLMTTNHPALIDIFEFMLKMKRREERLTPKNYHH